MTEDANLGPLRSVDGFEQLALARRSVRRFSDTPVPEAMMRSAFRSAHLAPSSNNLQPWEFHWVRPTSSDRAAAVEACLSQPAAATSAELVFFIGRPDLLDARAAAMVAHFEAEGNEGTASYYRDQVAQNVQKMAPEVRNAWVDKSVALAAAQFMLAIKAAGFDSCPMEGLVPDKVRALLGLPSEATVTMAISVGQGIPEGLYGPRLRFPLEDHLTQR
jgi:nitroreductase